MILTSSKKITDNYNINEVLGSECTVTVINLNSETIIEHDEEVSYEYEAYELTVMYRPEWIASHVAKLIEIGRKKEQV